MMKNGFDKILVSVLFIVIISLVVFFIDTITPKGYLDWFLYLAVILYAATKLPKYYVVIFGTTSILLSIAGFFLSPPGISAEVAIINRTIGILILWVTATFLYNQNKDKESIEGIIQQLKAAIDKISSGVVYFNIDGWIQMLNKNFAEFLGYEPDEMLYKNIHDFAHPDYREEFLETKEKIILGLLNRDFMQTIFVKKNGEPVLVNISLNITQGISNTSKTFIAFIQDSKRRKRKGKNLIQERELLLKKIPY